MISILILTLNEETNLPSCLESVKWSNDIVVFDSYSTDRTVEVAKEAGVRVIQREFDDYAGQRNAALNEVDYKYPWVLMIDADEIVPEELFKEIDNRLKNINEKTCLFRMRRKDFFMGKWIRYSSGYPTWFGRLIKIGYVHIERAVNEEYYADGKVELLKEHLLHYPFNKGFSAWLERHNRYSTMEAALLFENGVPELKWSDLFRGDATIRRKNIKALLYRLPCRPFLVFFALYILRRGFLDGRAGLTFCLLRTFYEFMIDNKVMELNRRKHGLPL